ncbi:MAG: hypothetical protein ACR2NP_18750 [Pirellulaceae bacterium]
MKSPATRIPTLEQAGIHKTPESGISDTKFGASQDFCFSAGFSP